MAATLSLDTITSSTSDITIASGKNLKVADAGRLYICLLYTSDAADE